MERIKVLFLYSEVMSYTIACLKALVNNYNVEVHVVRWDKKKLTPFNPPLIDGIHYYLRSELNDKRLKEFARTISPSLCFISGWMDKSYLKVAKDLRNKNVPVIGGLDNHWKGTIKQRLACLLAPIKIKPYFSHLFVAGIYQYEFARRLGFPSNKIITNVYSADVSLFEKAFYDRTSWNKRILYVGRLNEIKGLELLIEVFNEIHNDYTDWELLIIGNGPLKDSIPQGNGIVLKDFMDSGSLIIEAQNASVFCLPSKKEPWGVVLHEFASTGLPLVTSDACGANTEFLKSGYNGYVFKTGDKASLKEALINVMTAPNDKIRIMGDRSHQLSKHITPESWAANLMSTLN